MRSVGVVGLFPAAMYIWQPMLYCLWFFRSLFRFYFCFALYDRCRFWPTVVTRVLILQLERHHSRFTLLYSIELMLYDSQRNLLQSARWACSTQKWEMVRSSTLIQLDGLREYTCC